MDFQRSGKSQEFQRRLKAFMDEHVFPNEAVYDKQLDSGDRWKVLPVIESLKAKAQAQAEARV